MKVAISHDYLNQYGGAERVVEVLCEMFPRAPLYTLLYDKKRTFGYFKGKKIYASFLNRFQFAKNHHRLFIPILPLVQHSLNLKNKFDLIISSSASYAKGIRRSAGLHICYCHTPIRYAWEENYLNGYAVFKNPISKILTGPARAWLRRWDKRAAQNVDVFLANSNFIADKIKKYYAREAVILYPPVNTNIFYRDENISQGNYYLMVGRMLHYKRFDLGIEAFNKLGLPLKIIGGGPELGRLKTIAKSNIEFLPFFKDVSELRKLYNGAKALIFPQVEDFGLVAAEAQACGLPVIAYGEGGAKEIVIDGKTGLLFNEQTPEAIIGAVNKFQTQSFSRETISASAARFSKENFKKRFLEIINQNINVEV